MDDYEGGQGTCRKIGSFASKRILIALCLSSPILTLTYPHYDFISTLHDVSFLRGTK